MNVYSISTQLCKTTLYTFIEVHLKSLLMIVILLHGINKIIIYDTFK